MRHPLRIVAFVVLGCLLAADVAHAYILPAEYILRMVADKRRRMGIRDLSVQLITELEGEEAPVEDRIYFKNPERKRRVRQIEDNTSVVVQREGREARGPDGALVSSKEAPADLLPTLLMPRGKDGDEMTVRLVEQVKRLDIDIKTVTLGRFNDTVAYIIGGRADQKDKGLLWIEKDSFLPLRLRLPKKGSRAAIDLRWLEFGSSTTGDWFPRVIERYVGDERVERSEVEKIELNKKVPESLFDLP